MNDVMLETMTGPELEEMYWESLMEDSAPMGALADAACCSQDAIDAFGTSFDIWSTENVLQVGGNKRAHDGESDTR